MNLSIKSINSGCEIKCLKTNYTSFYNLGKLLTHQQITDGNTYNTSYQYDAFGALKSETYPSGRTVKMDYNSDGEIASIWGTKGTQNSLYANAISYNSAGAMERLRLGNGKWETAKYNERLQVTQIGLGNSTADTSLLKLEFSYGTATQNNGSMRSQKISFNGLSQSFEQVYAYDDLNRLQSAEEKVNATTTWKQTFQFDRFGNRRLDAANTTTIGASNKVTNPLINTSDNRLKKDQDNDSVNDYDYDKNGNLTQDSEGKTFVYDAENHQKEVKINRVSKGTYLYDGDGKRVKKISDLETTIFVYNGGGQLVAEYSTQQSTTPQVSFLTADHLGSPRIITDNIGKVIARKDFNAFGDETNSAQRTTALGYKPEEIRQDYTGYQKDDESGLEFAQARYYNTKHGRFTSVDPLVASANVKDPQTFNRYSYAMNSPYKFTDPLGLIAEDGSSRAMEKLNCNPKKDSSCLGGGGALLEVDNNGNPVQQTQTRQIVISGGSEEQRNSVQNAINTLKTQSFLASLGFDVFESGKTGPSLEIEILSDADFAAQGDEITANTLAFVRDNGGSDDLNPEIPANSKIFIRASAIDVKQENSDRTANRETQLEGILAHELGHAVDLSRNGHKDYEKRHLEDKKRNYQDRRNEKFADFYMKLIGYERQKRFNVTGQRANLRFTNTSVR